MRIVINMTKIIVILTATPILTLGITIINPKSISRKISIEPLEQNQIIFKARPLLNPKWLKFIHFMTQKSYTLSKLKTAH